MPLRLLCRAKSHECDLGSHAFLGGPLPLGSICREIKTTEMASKIAPACLVVRGSDPFRHGSRGDGGENTVFHDFIGPCLHT